MAIKSSKNTTTFERFKIAFEEIISLRGLNQSKIASLLGIETSTMSNYLNRGASIAAMEEISDKLGLDLVDLLAQGRKILEGHEIEENEMSLKSAKDTTTVLRFHASLLKWFTSSGKKQAAAAELFEMSQGAFNNLINAKKGVSVAQMEEIADKLGRDLTDMLVEGRNLINNQKVLQANAMISDSEVDEQTAAKFKASLQHHFDKLEVNSLDEAINSYRLEEYPIKSIFAGQIPSLEILKKIAYEMDSDLETMLDEGHDILAARTSGQVSINDPDDGEFNRRPFQAIYLDSKMMTEIVMAVEEYLIENNKKLSPKDKADVIIEMYEKAKKAEEDIPKILTPVKISDPMISKIAKLAVDEPVKKTG